MALRRREAKRQQDLWISTSEIARSPGHVFYSCERRHGPRVTYSRLPCNKNHFDQRLKKT